MHDPLFQKTDTKSPHGRLPKRDEADAQYTWRLEDIFASTDDWEASFARVQKLIDEVSSFKGRLDESPGTLYSCLQASDDLGRIFDSLYVYAHLWRDQDTGKPEAQALADKITILATKVRKAESYLSPEILSLGAEKIDHYVATHEGLALYRMFLYNILRTAAHTLTPSEEELLASAANVSQGPRNIFNMLNNADMKFPEIKDEKGNMVEVTKGRYAQFMESRDRRVRKDAYNALLGTYGQYQNTLAATLSANVNRDIFYARARRYDSCLEGALDAYNIPVGVYDNVVRVVNENLEPLHRYMSLRKKMLGLDELRPYDLFVPIFPDVDEKMTYQESVETIVSGLAPMGEEYVGLLKKGFDAGWVDVYENEGKRSGAYSWGAYGTHPYILLNFQGRLDDMFTIAHEMGHALHTYFTYSTQPYVYGNYSIFTAEVASTTNEAILMDHLLKNTNDPKRKLFLLNHYLDQIRSTVYTQVLFAEFEKATHERVESGQPLTADEMGTLFERLYKKYNGPEVIADPSTRIYWSRVPHFYSAFYVYQYATGYSAATMLSQQILRGEEGALDRYVNFLRSGSSQYPIDLLQGAGVDMLSPTPIEETVGLFARLLDEMESLIG